MVPASRQLKTIVCALGVVSAAAWAHTEYVVQEGDTLSAIVYRLLEGRVYGVRGNLKKTATLNESKTFDPHQLKPGQKLLLPGDVPMLSQHQDSAAAAREPASVTALVVTPPVTPAVPAQQTATNPAAPTPSVESAQAEQSESWLRLKPNFFFNRIDATDKSTGGHATVASALGLGVALEWSQLWSSQLQTHVQTEIQHSVESTSPQNLDHPSLNVAGIEGGATWTPTEQLQLPISLGMEQAPFIRALNTSTLTLDRALIVRARAGIDGAILRGTLFELRTGAAIAVRSSASIAGYKANWGYDYELFLGLQQRLGTARLESKIFFSQARQNTTFTRQTERSVGLELGVAFDLTPRAQKSLGDR